MFDTVNLILSKVLSDFLKLHSLPLDIYPYGTYSMFRNEVETLNHAIAMQYSLNNEELLSGLSRMQQMLRTGSTRYLVISVRQ